MKNDLIGLSKTLPKEARMSFISLDPDGDTLLSMERSKFIPALSKLDLSTSTEVFNPIIDLYNLIENYKGFLNDCGPDDSNYEDDNRKGVTFCQGF